MDVRRIAALFFLFFCTRVYATPIELTRLQAAYPDAIQSVSSNSIVFKDGSRMTVTGASGWGDFMASFFHHTNSVESDNEISLKDLQCDSYQKIFKKIYGGSASMVKAHLVTVYWMPHVFGQRYPLRVTTVNDIDKRIQRISAELEQLPPSDYKYVENPGGTFYWRRVAREKYLSSHSFGLAMDINSHHGNYWMWDWERAGRHYVSVKDHNHIPLRIVQIFENEGFVWGGRWFYYDTMHFEYRPELFTQNADPATYYKRQATLRCNL